MDTSNYIAVLAVDNEDELLKHHHVADSLGIPTCLVREPDLDDLPTALVIAPSVYWTKLSHLPLALKEAAMV